MSAQKTVAMSANQHAATFFAKAIEIAQKSPNKKVNLPDVFASIPKPKQQTFTKNGITIEFPVGYRSIHAYRSYLADTLKPSYRLHADFVKRNTQQLALIDAALA